MSNIIVDGFALYGTGSVGEAMTEGVYADTGTGGALVNYGLSWDDQNEDYWLNTNGTSYGPYNYTYAVRRVLPSAVDTLIVSCYMTLANLPGTSNRQGPIDFRDGSNSTIARVFVQPTGGMTVYYNSLSVSTNGPVITAKTIHHIEMKIFVAGSSTGTIELYVDGEKVIDASGLTFSNTNPIAMFNLAYNYYNDDARLYVSHLIVRDTNGTINNDIAGDRKVATLLPNADDDANQGWTGHPLRRFGTGILDLTEDDAAVLCSNTTDTDIGNSDFTLEGQFRFQSMPDSSNKAVFFGKWDETNDTRSYQLYMGGPDLESGLTVFRTSTDGTSGTVATIGQWDWSPEIGQWYHVCLERVSGEVSLYIDGARLGTPFTGSETAYAGAAYACIGGQTTGSSIVGDSTFDGWQDAFRLTIGDYRYGANFTPPTDDWPVDGADPDWAYVACMMNWNTDSVDDDGPNNLTLTARNDADAITPTDGDYNYQLLDKLTPDDDTFIDAALIPATGTFTMTALPTAGETVTVGTTDGVTAAVYEFVASLTTAFDVLIGADVAETAANLEAAINNAAGEGTTYGTGTTANADVTAETDPSSQVIVTAITPGTAGNSIASTDTCADGSWTDTTLDGGEDIPDFSQFSFERMPAGTTVVDSITFATRQWKNDAGAANTQISFVGGGGAVESADARVVATAPTFYFDTIEEDPDTASGLTPTSILTGKVRINRTV